MTANKPRDVAFNRHIGRLPPVLVGSVATVAVVPPKIQRELSLGRLNTRYELAPLVRCDSDNGQTSQIAEMDIDKMQGNMPSDPLYNDHLGSNNSNKRQTKKSLESPISPNRPRDRLQPILKSQLTAETASSTTTCPFCFESISKQPHTCVHAMDVKLLGSQSSKLMMPPSRYSTKMAPLKNASSDSSKSDKFQRPPYLDRQMSFLGLVDDYDLEKAPTAAAAGTFINFVNY